MPYMEVSVPAHIFFIHRIGRLYIPVYETYANGRFDERKIQWYSLSPDCDDPDFDVTELPGGKLLNEICHVYQSQKWVKWAQKIISNAINKGQLPDKVYPTGLNEKIKQALAGIYKPQIPERGCGVCGNKEFYGMQICRRTVLINENGLLENVVNKQIDQPVEILEMGPHKGPYKCSLCSSIYQSLPGQN